MLVKSLVSSLVRPLVSSLGEVIPKSPVLTAWSTDDTEILTAAQTAVMTDVDISFKIKGTDANRGAVFCQGSQVTGKFILLFDSTSSSTTTVSGELSAVVVTIDGVNRSGISRSALQALLFDGVEHSVSITSGANLSSWDGLSFGGYVSGTWATENTEVYDLVIDGVSYPGPSVRS